MDRRPGLEPGHNHIAAEAPNSSPAHVGRGGGTRTRGPLLPKQVRYQTALHPEMKYSVGRDVWIRTRPTRVKA